MVIPTNTFTPPPTVSNSVGSSNKYEGKDNAGMSYYRRAKREDKDEEPKEKKEHYSNEHHIDFVA